VAEDERDDRNERDAEDASRTTRRRFLTSTAAAGVGGAATLAGLGAAVQAQAQGVRWNREVDVVVIGAGASGLPAAIAARDAGASVLVVEQHFDIGGIAIMSGGMIHLGGGNSFQKQKGVEDSPDKFFADWTRPDNKEARFNDRELVRKFADEAVATYDFLTQNGLDWDTEFLGRSDASTLARQVRPKEWPVRSQLVALDQRRNGSGIVRALERSARQKGVEFLLSHKLASVVRERERSGRVIGATLVQVDREFRPTNQTVNVRARRGVILCTGGHGNNVELRRMFDPRLTEEYQWHGQNLAPHNGDGMKAALAVGGTIWTTANQTAEAGSAFDKGRLATRDNYIRGLITPESPIFFRERASGMNVSDWQNLILVKENGKRFWDELDNSYDGYFASAMAWSGDPAKLNGGGPIWAIFDAAAVKREKWGTEAPVVDRERGYFFSADTLEQLASQLTRNPYQWRPMPGAALRETVERFNSFVDTGVDADFKRRTPPYKIETPPFYAAWATPSLHDSLTGVRTNTRCQALTAQGEVIPGLFCAGEAQGGFALHGLGRCITFGRIAGMEAAKGEQSSGQ
jgi:succinate dehydrogenase/fumarate reductase flavoprotein subunit